jgi:hypothetical protein
VIAGSPAFPLTVNGAGFQAGSKVQWNKVALNTRVVSPGQLTADVTANLITAQGSAAITVMNPGNVTSGPVTFTISPPAIKAPDPEVESVKSVLREFADAYTRKDFKKVSAIWAGMSKDERRDLQGAFKLDEYKVSYNLELTAVPAIKGDDATVNARTTVRTTYGKTVRDPVTRDVVISLHRVGGQWTISGFR